VLLAALAPGAGGAGRALEGFGASTAGGAGGVPIAVTSLADRGPGTLREALAGAGRRHVTFATAGTIELRRRLEVRGQAGVTVDGASAPAPGVTLRGHGLHVVDSRDVVVSHLRVRAAATDGFAVTGSRNVVIDHCSVTDSGDENVSVTEGARDVTVSWCLIGDTRGEHGEVRAKGMLVASFKAPPVSHVSIHHNLFVNESQRSPQISSAGLFDLRNNVIRAWSAYGVRVRQGAWGNVVGNVFASARNPGHALVLGADAGAVWVADNAGPDAARINELATAPAPFAVAPVPTLPAEAAEALVLARAGASPRDAIDAALVGAVNESAR
jgi:pectate lyase